MGWLWRNPAPVWQWVGIVVTIAGTALSCWAALAAQSARKQAKRAAEAAVRLGRVVQAADLILELKELESLLVRGDLDAVVDKATHVRGRVARFRSEAYHELPESELGELLLATDQLARIASINAGRQQPANKTAAIRVALSDIALLLNAVAGRRVAADREAR